MAGLIKPFRGTYYNPKLFNNFSKIVCPPYDVIDKKMLSRLRKNSPHNFSHVLLVDDGDYKRVGNLFKQWYKDNILIDEAKDCLYLYEQEYNFEGNSFVRYGFLTLLSMNKEKSISAHEHTLVKPKEDRKRLIKEVEANLSPVFVIIPKTLTSLQKTYKSYSRKKPLFAFKDANGIASRVWKIDNDKEIKKICSDIEDKKMVIADGHHRFEVSYDYFLENKDKFPDLNYLLAYITDRQKGLLILPTHRIVTIKDPGNFWWGLEKYFKIKEMTKEALERVLEKKFNNLSFGLYKDKKYYFLKLKNKKILASVPGQDCYKQLDTYLLKHFVFTLFSMADDIEYSHSIKEAQALANKKDKAAFILRPLPLEVVFNMANKGYRLPQKSTYFYPKLSSGIIVRRFGH